MTDKNEKRVRIAITNRDDDEPAVAQDEVMPKEQEEAAPEDELEAIRQEAAEYKDKYLRTAAEVENTRKRAERRYADLAEEEKKRLLRAFLNVADNLERALAHSGDGFRDGVRLTYQDLQRLLSREGVEPLDAVDTVAGDNDQETVVGERQKGYLYRGEMLRPAKVQVAIPVSK
jgi:molecular chaperone GrpE